MVTGLPQPATAAAGPGVSLFPTAVRDHIKFTQESAAQTESVLQSTVANLEEQMASYQAARCDGATNDRGCAQIKEQISTEYKRLLEGLRENLPDMERAIRQTNVTLGRRLRTEIGQKMTPADIQELVSKSGNGPTKVARQSRMSANFQRYYSLVRTNTENDLTTLAAQIYNDTESSMHFIELTKAEIDRALVSIELNQFFGDVTEGMINTVDSVKALLFEPPEDATLFPEDLPPIETEIKSDWEI